MIAPRYAIALATMACAFGLATPATAQRPEVYVGIISGEHSVGAAAFKLRPHSPGWYAAGRRRRDVETRRSGWSASAGVTYTWRSWLAGYSATGVLSDADGTWPRLELGVIVRPLADVALQLGYDVVQLAWGDPVKSGTIGFHLSHSAAVDVMAWTADVIAWTMDLGSGPSLADLSIGMSAAAVRDAWGDPDHVQVVKAARDRTEVWFYGGGYVVYLVNGRVTIVQKLGR